MSSRHSAEGRGFRAKPSRQGNSGRLNLSVEELMAAHSDLAMRTSSAIKGNNPSLDPTWLPALVRSFVAKLALCVLLAAVTLASWPRPALSSATPTITYVQGNYATPQTPQTAVSVTFTAAQAAAISTSSSAGTIPPLSSIQLRIAAGIRTRSRSDPPPTAAPQRRCRSPSTTPRTSPPPPEPTRSP